MNITVNTIHFPMAWWLRIPGSVLPIRRFGAMAVVGHSLRSTAVGNRWRKIIKPNVWVAISRRRKRIGSTLRGIHYYSRAVSGVSYPAAKWALIAACAGITVFLIPSGLPRLAPESSPVARSAAMAGVYGCLQDHGKNEDQLPNVWSLSCETQPATTVGHPLYDASCEDMLAFFAVVRIVNPFAERGSTHAPNRLLAGEQLACQFYCFFNAVVSCGRAGIRIEGC